jgi:hypothetical protein
MQATSAGSQIGANIGANLRAMGQLREQQRQFDVEQQFKQQVQQYQVQLASLAVEKAKTARDYEYQIDRAATEIGKIVNTTPPDAPDFVSRIGEIASRYPAVMRDPVYQHAITLPEQSARIKLQQAETIKALNPNPANAADEAAIANQIKDEEALAVAQGKPSYTPEERIRRSVELRTLKEFKPPLKGGLSWDDQGRPIITLGEGPTVATSSLVQKNINLAEKNYQLLDSLDKNLRTADLGVPGVIGEVIDRYAPQLGLPGFDAKRASNRSALKVAVQSMVRQISSDTGRFSEADRKRAEDAMVSFGAGENKERASAVLGELKDIIRGRTRIDASTGGMPVPEFAMTPDEITKAVQTGKMTKEKGVEMRLKYFPEIYGPASR